jgi:hypothetical protein
MTWVKLSERHPPEVGFYTVIKFHPATPAIAYFKARPAERSIEYLKWEKMMKLENDYEDRCVYRKYYCFTDGYGTEQSTILYWYELDPVPEDED